MEFPVDITFKKQVVFYLQLQNIEQKKQFKSQKCQKQESF